MRSQSYIVEIAKKFNITTAIVYNQLLFWSDKGGLEDGWIYKTYEELSDELGLSPKQIRNAYIKLEGADLIETKVNQIQGIPIKHFRCKDNAYIKIECVNLTEGKCKKVTLESDKRELSSIYTEDYSHKGPLIKENTINSESNTQHKTFFKQPNLKKKKKAPHEIAQAKELCQLFSEAKGGSYLNTIHLEAMVGLLRQHGYDRTVEVANFALQLKPKEFQIQINKPVDLGDHWSKVVDIMEGKDDLKPKGVQF
jgi:predicted transcriptional regulator